MPFSLSLQISLRNSNVTRPLTYLVNISCCFLGGKVGLKISCFDAEHCEHAHMALVPFHSFCVSISIIQVNYFKMPIFYFITMFMKFQASVPLRWKKSFHATYNSLFEPERTLNLVWSRHLGNSLIMLATGTKQTVVSFCLLTCNTITLECFMFR